MRGVRPSGPARTSPTDQELGEGPRLGFPPVRPLGNALRSCGLIEGVAGTVSTVSLTIRLGGRAAVRVPARGTHAARIAVMIHVTHATTWAAMEFLCAGVPACFGAPTHFVAHRLSACGSISLSVSLRSSGPDRRQKWRHVRSGMSPISGYGRTSPAMVRRGSAYGFSCRWRSPRAAPRQHAFRTRGVAALSGRAATP